MAELVDAPGLGPGAFGREGSSPFSRTSKLLPEPSPVETGWDAVSDDEQRSSCQASGFVEAGLSGGGGGCLWLFVAVGVGCPGGVVLGGGSRADGGVWPDGARTSGPARRWRPRVASMSCQGPWLRMSSALYKELERLGQGKAERNPL